MKRFKKAILVGGMILALSSVYGCGAEDSPADKSSDVAAEKSDSEEEKDSGAEDSKDKKEEEKKDLAPELTVSAAASLRESFTEIAANFEKEYGTKVELNFGSSGALQKQIEEGAPSDYFVSAGKKQMAALEEQNLVDADTVKDLLGNELVFAVPKGGEKIKIADLPNVDGQIAIAETESVPVGQYTKQSLENLGIWDQIQDKIVYAKDVKATTAYIEQGEVVGGFIYKSDAVAAQNAEVSETVAEDTHDPIVYPEGIISSSEKKETAEVFSEFLKTPESKAIFEKYGFQVK